MRNCWCQLGTVLYQPQGYSSTSKAHSSTSVVSISGEWTLLLYIPLVPHIKLWKLMFNNNGFFCACPKFPVFSLPRRHLNDKQHFLSLCSLFFSASCSCLIADCPLSLGHSYFPLQSIVVSSSIIINWDRKRGKGENKHVRHSRRQSPTTLNAHQAPMNVDKERKPEEEHRLCLCC